MSHSPHTLAGVLFDKDGTLLDFEATWSPATVAVILALAKGDESKAAALAASAGFDLEMMTFQPDSPIIAGDTGTFAADWAEHLGMAFDERFAQRVDALYRRESLKTLTAYGDVARNLDRLRAAGLQVGLATNDSEETARAHLRSLGIANRFSFVGGYDSGHGSKPDPGMVTAFAETIGTIPERVVMIGDSKHDIDAARAAGAQAIGIARTPAAALALHGYVDALVLDLDELSGLLAAENGARKGERLDLVRRLL